MYPKKNLWSVFFEIYLRTTVFFILFLTGVVLLTRVDFLVEDDLLTEVDCEDFLVDDFVEPFVGLTVTVDGASVNFGFARVVTLVVTAVDAVVGGGGSVTA